MGTFSVRKTTEQFIAEAVALYGEKYDYSKVDYKTNKDKVCIICPEHGEFWQAPNGHLRGHGCPKCYQASKRKFGVGICDIPGACKEDTPFYKVWSSIMLRATNEKHKKHIMPIRIALSVTNGLLYRTLENGLKTLLMAIKKGYISTKIYLLRVIRNMPQTSVALCQEK